MRTAATAMCMRVRVALDEFVAPAASGRLKDASRATIAAAVQMVRARTRPTFQ